MEIIAVNKKANDYEIIEKYEAGIELKGTEVKSLREKNVSFKDSFCRIKDGEVYLLNLHISPYRFANIFNHDPERPRKLLLHKREIKRLSGKLSAGGYTLIPTKIYFNDKGKVKVEIALAKGKKKYDKRQEIKEKEIEKRLRSIMKYRGR
ncbi:SsrA-binding protein SmpB [Pseudothermotoga thermarum]|uniref:SsrA-binding protein n=1 Tax=Pseudothermotoga thermarum DSM 5069 TaxID=688269 RepID=F7YYV7_9THEM|nr:SsrA-binding protein SmpB [Pseudothermotoga thermarum]AEH51150.1 SsrA-binding protein [Pseudothermotoga thermarum DSM 5069]